jgi:hypothetical protein
METNNQLAAPQTPQLTPETAKALAEFQQYVKMLEPAKLDLRDETAVKQVLITLAIELRKRGWPETVANMYRVTNEILFEDKLTWVPGFEPAKLKAFKVNTAVRNQTDAVHDANDFSARLKASEVADAQRVKDEASIAQAKSLIAAYAPTRNGRLIYSEQGAMQEKWSKALENAIGKENLQTFAQNLAAAVKLRYKAFQDGGSIREDSL